MRRSSVIWPSSIGTLKSARISTSFPFTSTSATVFFAIVKLLLRFDPEMKIQRRMLRGSRAIAIGKRLITGVPHDCVLNGLFGHFGDGSRPSRHGRSTAAIARHVHPLDVAAHILRVD